jgi:hypothetical protein
MLVGTLPRAADDNFTVGVDFGPSGVFGTSPVSAATVVSTPPSGAANLTIGTPSIAANVVTFRVSGGAANFTYHVSVLAANAAGDDLCRSIDVPTEAC